MEKFALLNLLKALDGLKSAQKTLNPSAETAAKAPPAEQAVREPAGDMPNLMYETLMRHEQMSNRLRNKK